MVSRFFREATIGNIRIPSTTVEPVILGLKTVGPAVFGLLVWSGLMHEGTCS